MDARVTFRLDDGLRQRLRDCAWRNRRTMSEIVVQGTTVEVERLERALEAIPETGRAA